MLALPSRSGPAFAPVLGSGTSAGKVDPTGLWSKYFHRYETYGIAKQLGIARYPREHVAGYAWSQARATFWMHDTDSRYVEAMAHRSKADRLARDGRLTESAFYLGLALHFIQDIFAHGNIYPTVHPQGSAYNWADDPSFRTNFEKRNGFREGWRASMAVEKSRIFAREMLYLKTLQKG